ncbi:hypothetical protein F5X68DRAFT_161182 [Plectosphaerella plurivora]|uniref:MacB-like periplasmic core domain-containing protein n=1 Tax=Plectosphaerella plurivora TaxID=936078 RepID=A0A9P8V1L1_9PEZI|nr:hypothetical protein F5X68DRAFT_161182 [Plectosphaerella plurivora]
MLLNAALAAAVFAYQAHAEIRPFAMDPMIEVRSPDVLDEHYQNVADRYLSKRQTVGGVSPDVQQWMRNTDVACRDALSRLGAATNPSGAGLCYNLPALDTNTGVFEADLRVFKVSEPSGFWAGIAPQNIDVGLSFSGASVSPVEASRVTGAGMQGEIAKRQLGAPELLQTYMFIGQIDQNRMKGKMSMADIEALIIPTLTLSAVNSTGQTVRTNVSSNEAAFLTGVFSKEVILSDFALAQQAQTNMTQRLANKEVAFVLPGVTIMIFPIGLIVTSVWLVIGLAAYGYGTYQRVGYAESFRRRQAVAGNTRKPI